MTKQEEANIALAEYQANRTEWLKNYYDAERNAGADPLLANERLHFHAKRMDAAYERDLETLRQCFGRKS